jgi:hypothetical protein
MDSNKVLFILERYYDEWSKCDDWWYGLDDCDINVFQSIKAMNGSSGYINFSNSSDCKVTVYGLNYAYGDDGEISQYAETDTEVVLDEFNIKGVYDEM